MKTEEILAKHVQAINDLQERVQTLEFILAQTLAITLQHSESPDTVMADMKRYFATKMNGLGISITNPSTSYDSAQRIYTSAYEGFLPGADN